MVRISKDALGDGAPNKDTFLTDYHMVYHPMYNNAKGVQASQMVDGDKVKYVAYGGHVHNILFDEYEHIRGHNLSPGTLPPAHKKRWESSLVFGPRQGGRGVSRSMRRRGVMHETGGIWSPNRRRRLYLCVWLDAFTRPQPTRVRGGHSDTSIFKILQL